MKQPQHKWKHNETIYDEYGKRYYLECAVCGKSRIVSVYYATTARGRESYIKNKFLDTGCDRRG